MIDPELAGVKITANGEEKPKRKRAIRKTTKKAADESPATDATEA